MYKRPLIPGFVPRPGWTATAFIFAASSSVDVVKDFAAVMDGGTLGRFMDPNDRWPTGLTIQEKPGRSRLA